MILIEFILTALSILIAFIFPNLGARWFEPLERGFIQLARRRGLAVIVVGITALVVRAALIPVEPIPQPGIHDEFAYLLAADTFAHGRLTNPTHPMWVHFETIHVNQRPTYCSKYYPAQGLILAIGQAFFGHPFWGVWLSVGLMCAAICWMLQAWLPPSWALLGGLLAVIRLGSFSYWANSYWGGAVAAIGGALVLGALPRIKQHPRVRDSLLMGLGLALLANSRPYESLFFCLPVAILLLAWMFGQNRPQQWWQKIVLPIGLVLVLTITAMGYYFWRTTGSPITTPYLLNTRTYNPVPIFPWQALSPSPEFHHTVIRDSYMRRVADNYNFARLHPGALALIKATRFWLFYFGPILTFPICMLGVILPYRMSFTDISSKIRFLLLVCLTTTLGLLLPLYFNPHYAAPLTAVVYALVLYAMQHLRRWGWHARSIGLTMVRSVPTICVLLLLARAVSPRIHVALPREFPQTWASPQSQMLDRSKLENELKGYPEHHLVIVRYQPSHDAPGGEWVYNDANIDNSNVVWARDIGEDQNQELIKYFRNRRVWLLEADKRPPKLIPYLPERPM
ncbi:MAG: hypothetical protein DMG88_15215 [Acidobacteria bacterium]|nr:MAG: hypothetical protein DMG88_15215 [Acidobacteriota bacterium]